MTLLARLRLIHRIRTWLRCSVTRFKRTILSMDISLRMIYLLISSNRTCFKNLKKSKMWTRSKEQINWSKTPLDLQAMFLSCTRLIYNLLQAMADWLSKCSRSLWALSRLLTKLKIKLRCSSSATITFAWANTSLIFLWTHAQTNFSQ
jgi:hypothetical protein